MIFGDLIKAVMARNVMEVPTVKMMGSVSIHEPDFREC